MILPLQKFSTLIENMAASVQGSATQLVDLSVGSVLRAMLEASAAVALWMQWLIVQVLAMTRAATSTGADLDSWMGDYGLVRLPGAASVGQATFSRYTPGLATTILLGTQVRTVDGSQTFSVVQDSSNPSWNGATGYGIAPLATSVNVPIQALTAGAAGNVQPGAIGILTTAVAGVDTVNNQAALTGGVDQEGDAALRLRFPLYINSCSKATVEAIAFAVSTVQQGLRYVVLENIATSGTPVLGSFWVVVDDGTGSPPNSLLTNVSLAVDLVRPIGATYSVTGPAILSVSIALSVVTSDSSTKPNVVIAIQQAIAIWVAALPIGATLAVSKLEALAHATDPSVVSVIAASINGSASDVTASDSAVILATSIVVN